MNAIDIIRQASGQERGRGTSFIDPYTAELAARDIDKLYARWIAEHYQRQWPTIEALPKRPVVGYWNERDTRKNFRWRSRWLSYIVYPYIPPVEVVAEVG